MLFMQGALKSQVLKEGLQGSGSQEMEESVQRLQGTGVKDALFKCI